MLLAVLIAYIGLLMPAKTPKERYARVYHRQVDQNYLVGQKWIVPLLPAPAAWWSPGPCGQIGQGVWLTRGIVHLQNPSGGETPSPWAAIFVPGDSQPLYLMLGPQEVGDRAAALARAGLPTKNP